MIYIIIIMICIPVQLNHRRSERVGFIRGDGGQEEGVCGRMQVHQGSPQQEVDLQTRQGWRGDGARCFRINTLDEIKLKLI